MRGGRLVRIASATVTIMVLAVALTAVGLRVLAPGENLTTPTVPYPAAVMVNDDQQFSELRAAPLVVEGRLRVYAERWRIWSDAPVSERYESTPYWSFRRWPAEVIGVVTVQTRAGPIVASQWTDGQLVAIDARRGTIRWRASAPIAEHQYPGRRTGAGVVYQPGSLLTVRTNAGTVVAVTYPGGVRGYDALTGALRWRADSAISCEPMAWSGAGLVAVADCSPNTSAAPAITLISGADGRQRARWKPSQERPVAGSSLPMANSNKRAAQPTLEPRLCELGHSECRAVSLGGRSWRLGNDARLSPVPSIEPGAVLAGEQIVFPTSSGVAARPLDQKAPLWTWPGQVSLLGADPVAVYVLSDDRSVLGLSPSSGQLLLLGCAAAAANEPWRPEHVHPTGGGYLAVERVLAGADPDDDQQYYFGPRPVALVELHPLPKLAIWPDTFSACRHP